MSYLQEIYEHLHPKLVSRIWVKDDSSDIMPKFFNDLDKMLRSRSFLHNWKIEGPDNSIRMSAITLYIDILSMQSRSLQIRWVHRLSPTDITHRYLIFLILWNILRDRMTHNKKFLFISNIWIIFKAIIAKLTWFLIFRKTSFNSFRLNQHLKYLAIFNNNTLP